ncbi:hypothetical protein [Nonomuraea sp. NPDC049758]|uniref:hypothetical protein n=1 Tax=Nonomuraea sp. NPDC049758 TaxID=3154360 RepID=UPI00342AD065
MSVARVAVALLAAAGAALVAAGPVTAAQESTERVEIRLDRRGQLIRPVGDVPCADGAASCASVLPGTTAARPRT